MESTDRCPACDSETTLVTERRSTTFGKRTVIVDDERLHCASCDEDFYTTEQADQLHSRVISQIRVEDGLLSPQAIKSIRLNLGLTQREIEQLIGTGEKTCVRWESGRVCQSVAADRLLRLLAANKENVAVLAGVTGVVLRDHFVFDERGQQGAIQADIAPLPPSRMRLTLVFDDCDADGRKSDLSRTAERAAIATVDMPHRGFPVAISRNICQVVESQT